MANYSKTLSVDGLSATTITVPTQDYYSISGKVMNHRRGSIPSAIVVTISITSQGTVYTGQAGAEGFAIRPYCNANDVITITLNSANVTDQGANIVKTTISISEGV